jgi:hypothetical protein
MRKCMTTTIKNPVTIVINRPHGDPIHLRIKGKPTMMEDGSVSITCKDERNRKFWISITPDVIKMMMDAV